MLGEEIFIFKIFQLRIRVRQPGSLREERKRSEGGADQTAGRNCQAASSRRASRGV